MITRENAIPILSALCVALAGAAGVVSCGLEEPIFGAATDKGPDWVPEAPDPYIVRGQVYAFPMAQVSWFSPAGGALLQFDTTAGDDGVFDTEFPGGTEYRNLVVQAARGGSRLLGLAVRLPRNRNIYIDVQKESKYYELGGMTWGAAARSMTNLDDRTTAMTLVLLRRAFEQGTNLGVIGIGSTNDALGALAQGISSGTGPAAELHRMVKRLLAASTRGFTLPPVFLFPDPAAVYLNPGFLAANPIDYTGDGFPDADTDAFEAQLSLAAGLVKLEGCPADKTITVVFMVDINEGNLNLNCSAINPFKKATKKAGKSMFLTGAMETEDPTALTPVCEGDVKTGCLTKTQWAEVNKSLGNWVPNTVPMRDDGQGGDAKAGDNVWTAVFDLPYIQAAAGARGVRIGYKYTWGFAGDGWGGTEEWPGGHRLLELLDVNGDGMVVRYDYFADETSNKNPDNYNKGLCGGSRNPWPEQAKPGCFFDVWENRVDSDGDCVPETFAQPGSVVPSCQEEGIPPIATLKGSDYEGAGGKAPVVQAAVPSSGRTGGGFLVELSGANLDPNVLTGLEVNTAQTQEVYANLQPGFLVPDAKRILFTAPPFVPALANVVLPYTSGDQLVTLKVPLNYTLGGSAPCSVVFPTAMPDAAAGVPAGLVDRETHPVLARLTVADPQFEAGFQVDVGISPPCCNEGDACALALVPCVELPDPRYKEGWSFFPMELDPACQVPEGSGLAACDSGVAQFVGAPVPAVAKARYRYAARYSFDAGLSWDYCDLPAEGGAAGNSDGFKLKEAPTMWVE